MEINRGVSHERHGAGIVPSTERCLVTGADGFIGAALCPTAKLMAIGRDDSEGWTALRQRPNVVAARVTADYISSLTEAQALNLHHPSAGSGRGERLLNWLFSRREVPLNGESPNPQDKDGPRQPRLAKGDRAPNGEY